MIKILSFILSILTAVFPFLRLFPQNKKADSDFQIVTMEENGSDIILFNEDGEEISEDIFASEIEEPDGDLLPSYYDAREQGLITSVKTQGNTGCCWAFAAMSAAETNMIKKGLAGTDVDYSEAHLVWFGLRSVTNLPTDPTRGDGIYSESPFADGGNWCRSVFTLARWSGAEKEENIPFDGFPYPEGNYPESERYNSYAHLQNSQYIDQNDREEIKKAILDCGSITASYYHSGTFLNNTENNGVCYYQKSVKNTNHTVAVIGWDDNYSADNFSRTPPADGAWLIKNSWGSNKLGGDYLWISYYDTSLSYFVTFEMESADNYENINQYDGFGYKGWGYLSGYNKMSMANIFRTKSKETIKAVSFHTVQPDIEYLVEIYTDIPAGGNPTDGYLVASENGYMKNRGYKTVPLSECVSLPKGARYSAVVTLIAPQGVNACIPLEFPDGFDGAHDRSYYAEEGQSFMTVSRNFDNWEDTALSGYHNVCIKTFSDNDSLHLKDSSLYKASDSILGYVGLNDDESFIADQFRNKNIGVSDGFVYLYDDDGKIIDSFRIAYLGDVDNDGDMDYDDCELIRMFAAAKAKPTEREWFSANIDMSDRVNAIDVSAFKKLLIKNGGKL